MKNQYINNLSNIIKNANALDRVNSINYNISHFTDTSSTTQAVHASTDVQGSYNSQEFPSQQLQTQPSPVGNQPQCSNHFNNN